MKKQKVLIIAPHPDDETLAMGGSISYFVKKNFDIFVLFVSGHLPPIYTHEEFEVTKKEAIKAMKILDVKKYEFLKIPATLVNTLSVAKLNSIFHNCIKKFQPTMCFIPFPDRHIDHRVIFESCMVATRPVGIAKKIHTLACYETLSETHWNAPNIEPNFLPNMTIDVSKFINKKNNALKCYKSQISKTKGARSLDAVKALAKFRGSQAGFDYGESFVIIRKLLT